MQTLTDTAPVSSSARRALGRLEELVLGADGLQWLEALHRLNVDRSAPVGSDMIDEFLALGICARHPDGIALTLFGHKCADSAREYLFWIGRDRKFHGEDELKAVRLESFREKKLLEIGAGWGSNLARLSRFAKAVVGLELEPVYVEFSRILSKREGVRPPQMAVGRGESTPFAAGSFDWVLVWNAIYYMNIDATLKECHRILRPHGRLLISKPSFAQALGSNIASAVRQRRVGALLRTPLLVADTAWYQARHERLRKNVRASSTARPVYVTKPYLTRRAARAGLKPQSAEQLSDKFIIVFQKH